MNFTSQGDAEISGSGRISGGMYRNISISGSGHMDGNVDALDVRISGSAVVYGSLKASSVKASGSAVIEGNVEAEECKVSGSGRVDGYAHLRKLSVNGSFVTEQGVRAEEVKTSGWFRSYGDVEAETFVSSGGVTIEGLLNASEVSMNMHGKCIVREIGGDRITVREGAPWNFVRRILASIIPFMKVRLEANVIEGTNVYVENTTANVIRGHDVTIGQDCEVEIVEYSGNLKVHHNARVREVREDF